MRFREIHSFSKYVLNALQCARHCSRPGFRGKEVLNDKTAQYMHCWL